MAIDDFYVGHEGHEGPISWGHGSMGAGGEGGAENREILIRAKVDFMFNRRGERKIFGRFRKEA